MPVSMEDKDSVIHMGGKKVSRVTLSFSSKERGDTIESPTKVLDKVVSMLQGNLKKVRSTVGILAELCVGPHPDEWRSYLIGWYMRKYIEAYEAKYGPCTIQIESDNVPREVARKKVAEFFRKLGKGQIDLADKIEKGEADAAFGGFGLDDSEPTL